MATGVLGVNEMLSEKCLAGWSPFQPSLHILDLLVLGVDDVSQESGHVQGLIVEALPRLCVLQGNSETKAKLE